MATISPTQLLAELQALASSSPAELDDTLRTKLAVAAKATFLSLEKPEDVVARVLLSQPVEGITVRIAIDLKLFSILKDGEKSLAQLVDATKATSVLLGRVLRSLAASGAIKETGEDKYALSPTFALFANPDFAAGLANCADFLNPAYLALPEFLKTTHYESPSDPTNTALQSAFDSKGKDLIGILMERPESARGFGTLMSTWGEGNSLIQDLYPIRDLGTGFDPESVMWVDVGGGYGQKTISLKRAAPELPGRFIVEDLPGTVQNAPKHDGIELLGHDFFTEQPIKGARAYYIRQCLHNWPADKCLTILTQLRKAMKPDYSKLFVHELIVPARGASTWVVTQDFNMMTLCATLERTKAQWTEILAEAGLKVVAVYSAPDGVSEGVLEVEVL